MESEFKYMVMALCLTYNHEHYLEDALKGFVMQKTNFPFIAVVIDDCSTDGTADVLRRYEKMYPDIIKAVYLPENYYSLGKSKLPLYEEYQDKSKYIALCEGDDYWTDPYKLQKQVDILESDETLMAVVTTTSVVDMKGNIIEYEKRGIVKDNKEGRYGLRDFFHNKHSYPTATVCYRNSHREEVLEMKKKTANPFFCDWNLWIILHIFGDFYYLNQVTSAYRINPSSVTHSNIDERRLKMAKANFKIQQQIKSILPIEYDDIKKELDHIAWAWYKLAIAYKHSKKYLLMCYALLRCFFEDHHYFNRLLSNRSKE